MKLLPKAGLLASGLVLAYLLVAAAWAWTSFGQAVRSAPPLDAVALSPRQAAILLLVEDPTFYQHAGLSIAPGQGLTTISGAVARDLYLFRARLDGVGGVMQSFYRAVFTCCRQVDLGRDVMALVLDANMPKRAQLDYFTAHVYMGTDGGRRIDGLAQASRAWLGKPLELATEPEFIRLVAMMKAPDAYHPAQHPAALAQRARRIQALVDGKCAPDGWLDTAYPACDAPSGSP